MKMMSHDNVVNEDFLRLTRLPRLWSLKADPVRESVSQAYHQQALNRSLSVSGLSFREKLTCSLFVIAEGTSLTLGSNSSTGVFSW